MLFYVVSYVFRTSRQAHLRLFVSVVLTGVVTGKKFGSKNGQDFPAGFPLILSPRKNGYVPQFGDYSLGPCCSWTIASASSTAAVWVILVALAAVAAASTSASDARAAVLSASFR